ncbi:ABC transporter ATP-binding protein [Lentibacillus cibarius]|uniref:ABC transporter ATP-binding protein n=1 Tax=Lentibacillus cibarius TaxID=2583219 RepID=A0A549YGI8_9BACI|nr:ABC transporter ATP-binding protein [Lentibacillus cibarius]TRM10999.1 ABC transporter ATP-binding protein [Lentibacillus cibarius]
MSQPNKNTNQSMATLKRLLRYLVPRRTRLVVVLIAVMLSTLFAILGPKVMGDTVTEVFEGAYAKLTGTGEGIDFVQVGKMLLLLAGLYVFSSLFTFIQQYLMASVAQNTVYDLRADIFKKLEKLPLNYYDSHSHGDTLSRVINDIDTIGNTLQQSITQFIRSMVMLVGIAIMMLTISPLLTLIAVVSIPVSLFVIKPFLKKSQSHFTNQQHSLGKLNGHIEEMYTNHQIIKAFGQEAYAQETFDDMNEELYHAGRRAQFISGIINPVMTFIGNLSYVLISIVGGLLVTQRAISIGDIQAFITYTKQFNQPINQTANIANIIQATIAAARRVFNLLDEEEEVPETASGDVSPAEGAVTFNHVAFGYDDEWLMEDLNIDVKPGQTVAIVGPTGAGKTTLINLLMRFYEVNAGSIEVDGKNILSMSRHDLRAQFGMVLQDTWLFNGSIKDNIAYGKRDASETEVIEAAKSARADQFIRTLPDGYDTMLNQDASNISQGQKQLLTIARAILADPSIMILDEATSSVDTRTEVFIQEAMNKMMEGRTSFVIAHRLSTIKNADKILVMNQGNVVEQGTHDELMEQQGFYADLYNSQFAEEQAG